MNVSSRALKGISLAWWPTLLQHFPSPDREVWESESFGEDTDSFTTALHNLANTLRLAEVGDLEEITLP